MAYQVFFDLDQSGFTSENFSFLVPGLVLAGLGVGMAMYRKHLVSPTRKRPMTHYFPALFILCGFLVTCLSFSSFYVARSAAREGNASIVIGNVTHFKTTKKLGHTIEEFCVGNSEACFKYSDYMFAPGFHQTSADGGPIHPYLPVRITYYGNTITRVEIGDGKADSLPPSTIQMAPAGADPSSSLTSIPASPSSATDGGNIPSSVPVTPTPSINNGAAR